MGVRYFAEAFLYVVGLITEGIWIALAGNGLHYPLIT